MTIVIPAWFVWALVAYAVVHIGLTIKKIAISREQVVLKRLEMKLMLNRPRSRG